MVLFDDVLLRYGAGPDILHRVSFSLAPGSFHFLVGPSGAGKSSLLRVLYLALRPIAGQVSLFGRDVAQLSRREIADMRRRIGVVFQDFRLIAHLSAVDNVALPLRIAGVRESEVQKNVRELLAWVGLGDHLDALPATLSGGQQQRVAIARAVITRPSLLLADEPTGNVDDQIGLRLLYLFEELNKLGTTVVVATHNEALVARFRHRQLRIEDHSLRAIDPGTARPADGDAALGLGDGSLMLRSDLPLDRDSAGLFLPAIIGFMVFLAALALAGSMAVDNLLAHWRGSIEAAFTVQLPPIEGESVAVAGERRSHALATLAATPGVKSAILLSDADKARLLEPWLGAEATGLDLPLPDLIAVTTRCRQRPSMSWLLPAGCRPPRRAPASTITAAGAMPWPGQRRPRIWCCSACCC